MQPAFLLAHSFNSPLIGTLLCLRLILDQARAICQPATESRKDQFVALLQFSAFFYLIQKNEKACGRRIAVSVHVHGKLGNVFAQPSCRGADDPLICLVEKIIPDVPIRNLFSVKKGFYSFRYFGYCKSKHFFSIHLYAVFLQSG